MNEPSYDSLMGDSKEYWITDGESKTYDLREEIQSWGGYWVPEHKSWAILEPCQVALGALKSAGLRFQFRRNK